MCHTMTNSDDIAARRWGVPHPPSMTPRTNHKLAALLNPQVGSPRRSTYLQHWNRAMPNARSFGIYMAGMGNEVGDPRPLLSPDGAFCEVGQNHPSARAFMFVKMGSWTGHCMPMASQEGRRRHIFWHMMAIWASDHCRLLSEH